MQLYPRLYARWRTRSACPEEPSHVLCSLLLAINAVVISFMDDATDLGGSQGNSVQPPRVIYVSSSQVRSYANLLPSNEGRSSIVHSLIEALDLLEYSTSEDDGGGSSTLQDNHCKEAGRYRRARAIEPVPVTRSDLCRFHDRNYIDTLFRDSARESSSPSHRDPEDGGQTSPRKRIKREIFRSSHGIGGIYEYGQVYNGEPQDHGLEHDCPVFTGMEDYCCYVAGGSITAARELRCGNADIAMFWDGGRHHATKSAAAGYCYINDVVLAILEIQKNSLYDKGTIDTSRCNADPPKRLKKVLYIDLDLHHGDGVAEAFETNPNVITVSMHLWSRGFYPSSPKGRLEYTGPPPPSQAANTTFNIAVPKSGLADGNFNRLVNDCINPIFKSVRPDALVLQCGMDGLAGDPCKEFNISLGGYGKAVQNILSWCRAEQMTEQDDLGLHLGGPALQNIPVLMLGGGGYHSTNAARAWTYLTSIALGKPLELDKGTIPESCKYWETFYNDNASGEGLDIPSHLSKRDENDETDMDKIIKSSRNMLLRYPAMIEGSWLIVLYDIRNTCYEFIWTYRHNEPGVRHNGRTFR